MKRAKLVISRNGRVVRRCVLHAGDRMVLGRSKDTNVRLKGLAVSRRHAALEFDGESITVSDLGSRNGTQVGAAVIKPGEQAQAKLGDPVLIGPYALSLTPLGALTPASDAAHARVVRLVAPDGIQIQHLLGRGATSTVWSGLQPKEGRAVAVKVLALEALSAGAHKRFLREGEIASRVRHPNVVEIYRSGVRDGTPYIVLELINGVSVMERLREGMVSISEALEIGAQIALALVALGEAGIVHRDVKPSNVLLAPDGCAKLSDFGIAKDLNATQQLTQAGVGLGTFSYMAPEQFREASTVEPSADLYGLGACLYHVLTQHQPFVFSSSLSPVSLIRQIMETEPQPITSLRPDCPPDVAELVHELLSKRPSDRPGPASAVAERIQELWARSAQKDAQRRLWESSTDTQTGD